MKERLVCEQGGFSLGNQVFQHSSSLRQLLRCKGTKEERTREKIISGLCEMSDVKINLEPRREAGCMIETP